MRIASKGLETKQQQQKTEYLTENNNNNDSFEIWGWRRALWTPWTIRKVDKFILEQIKLKTSLEAKIQNCPTSGSSWEGGFLGKDDNAEKNKRQQEKRKTRYEMDWLHNRSHRHKSTGAEQHCWAQDMWTWLSPSIARSHRTHSIFFKWHSSFSVVNGQ